MKSIRTWLVIGTVAATLAGLSVASIAIYRGARATLLGQFDEELREELLLIASTVRVSGGAVDLEFEELDLTDFTSPSGPGYLQLWSQGNVLYRSPGLGNHDLEFAMPADLDRSVFQWTTTPSGKQGRAVGIRFLPKSDEEGDQAGATGAPPGTGRRPAAVELVVAEEPGEIVTFLSRLKYLLMTVGGFTALGVAVMLTVVIRTSLRPLDELTGQIASLSNTDMSARVALSVTPREVEPIVAELNQLLARLETTLEQERTFSADIAHELRTPLAGLRSAVEVALARPRAADDYRDTLESSLTILLRVQAMVETLLYLGRLESGQIEIEESPADVGELVEASWIPLDEAARARRLDVTFALPRGVQVITDPILLEIAIRNVLENAVVHSNEAGYVRIEATQSGGSSILRIANSGSQVAPEGVATLLHRFARGDASRRASGEHFGLGLALVAKIAAALRFTMRVESSQGGEFAVTFVMPGK